MVGGVGSKAILCTYATDLEYGPEKCASFTCYGGVSGLYNLYNGACVRYAGEMDVDRIAIEVGIDVSYADVAKYANVAEGNTDGAQVSDSVAKDQTPATVRELAGPGLPVSIQSIGYSYH